MKVAERYTTIGELASGGMGSVDLAVRREGTFERLYALKRLRPQLRDDQELRVMFTEEARLAGLVRHANVVSVLDVGTDALGPYLVMDFVDGVPLDHILRHQRRAEQWLPLSVATTIIAQTASGLHAAHELCGENGRSLELVHRDVSPSNILVGFDGVTRLTDFGIARALGRTTKTSTGVLKGKLSFMSPEQLRFEEADRRSDIFALGTVLFFAVAGEHPFGNDATERARGILRGEVPDLGEARELVPPALVELVMEMLSPHPEDRPQTALQVKERLGRIANDWAALEEPVGTDEFMTRVFGELQQSNLRHRASLARPHEMTLAEGAKDWRPERRTLVRAAWITALAATVSAAAYAGSLFQPTPPPSQSVKRPQVGVASAENNEAQVVQVHAPPSETASPRTSPEGATHEEPTKNRGDAHRQPRMRASRPSARPTMGPEVLPWE